MNKLVTTEETAKMGKQCVLQCLRGPGVGTNTDEEQSPPPLPGTHSWGSLPPGRVWYWAAAYLYGKNTLTSSSHQTQN